MAPYRKCVNIEQENALEELKSRVKNELTSSSLLEDDAIFYKYLKSGDFDIDKAEKRLRKYIVWRKVFQVDQILETFKPKEIFVKYIEPNFIGFDKEGDMVRFIAVGIMNSSEIFKCIKMNDAIRHWIWFGEKNKREASKKGNQISMSVIVDLDKLELANTTSKLSVNFMIRLSSILRDNYAERVKAIYVINAPSYFVLIYTIIKSLLSNSIIKRLHIYGYSGWKEELLENIDANILPAFLGGNRTDPNGDPYCRSFITLYDKIPERYYLSEEERYFENPAEVSSLVILPSEKKKIFLPIQEQNSWIHWKFMVRNKTIRFGLFLEESETKMKEILPLHEYDTSDGTEENSYKCLSKGKYVIIFDNTYSKIFSKDVQYVTYVKKSEI